MWERNIYIYIVEMRNVSVDVTEMRNVYVSINGDSLVCIPVELPVQLWW